MARDHALALGLRPGTGVVRLYRWATPTVSFGRNEPARGVYDEDAARARGWGFVRRPTGGRAVLHHREVTYAVVAPVRALGGPRATYRTINHVLVRGLALLGVEAEIASGPPDHAAPLTAGPCFHEPAEGEVVSGGRKLVGSAQARVGDTVLQHGSLLLEDDQSPLSEIRSGSVRPRAPGTLAGLMGRRPTAEEVVEAVAGGFREGFHGPWGPVVPEAYGTEADLLAHYRSRDWTWRR